MNLLQKLKEAEKDLEKGIKPIPAKDVFSRLKLKHFGIKGKREHGKIVKKITPELNFPGVIDVNYGRRRKG